ncbi:MAG TPA: ATP-binding protein [Labilithrix sp.]|nr:ATP-binding protein [Labilithrix sp.]
MQLRQAQKMEAVGRLAGGIAHDFNNLLTVILSYAAILKSTLPADSSADESLEEIEIAGERAAALTRQLLVFSRQQVLELRVLDLNRVVLGMQTIARTLLTENVELVVALGEDVGRIEVDQSQVEQVIVNLVVNARDAMPDGGVLTLATKRVVLDAEEAGRVGIAPGAYAVLVASDTGVGIDEAAKPYLFEPFFTTKEAGKGTGLGLATILGIVKQAGGHITVESERGKGATFRAYFPRVELPLSPSPAPVSPLPTTGGNERILLVEDEAQVRVLMRNVLRRAGYDVIDARSPEEALVEEARVAGELPLLVTDVILPKMSGRELAERFLERRPDAKVLYVSGYTEDVIGQHGVLVPGIELLRKPITPELLLRRVRSVLDS